MSFDAVKKLSVDDFRKKLKNWFSEQGHLADLQSLLRQKLLLALQETSLRSRPESEPWCFLSVRNYAITFLVAEFLSGQGYHYTLSVFTSEVHKAREVPGFPPGLGFLAGRFWLRGDSPSRLRWGDVRHVMEALGFPPRSLETAATYDAYQGDEQEPLLSCVLRAALHLASGSARLEQSPAQRDPASTSPAPPQSQVAAANHDPETTDNIYSVADKRVKTSNVRKIIHKLKRQYERQLRALRAESEVRREREASEHRLALEAAEAAWRRELVEREALIQDEIARHKEETRARQERLDGDRAALQEQTLHLQHQRNELDMRIKFLEDYMAELRQFEKNFQDRSEEELLHIAEQKRQLQLKQQQVDEGFRRLDGERQAVEDLQREVEDSYRCVLQASASLGHAHGAKQELARLREELDAARRKLGSVPHAPRQRTPGDRAEVAHTVCHRSQQTDPAEPQEQPGLLKRLRAENCDLRAHVQQLRRRIEELMLQAVRLTRQLDAARDAIRALSSQHSQRPDAPGPSREAPGARAVPSSGSDDGSPTEDVLREAKARLRELARESEAVDRSYRSFRERHSRSLGPSLTSPALPRPPPYSVSLGRASLFADTPRQARLGAAGTATIRHQWLGSARSRAAPVSFRRLQSYAPLGSSWQREYSTLDPDSVLRRKSNMGAVPHSSLAHDDQKQPAAHSSILVIEAQRSAMKVPSWIGDTHNVNHRNVVQTPLVYNEMLRNETHRNLVQQPSVHQDVPVNKTQETVAQVHSEMRDAPEFGAQNNRIHPPSMIGYKTHSSVIQVPSPVSDSLDGTRSNIVLSVHQDVLTHQSEAQVLSEIGDRHGAQRNLIPQPSISSEGLGDETHQNVMQLSAADSNKLVGRTQQNMEQAPSGVSDTVADVNEHKLIQDPFVYSDAVQNEAASNVMQDPTAPTDKLETRHEEVFQSTQDEHHKLQVRSDFDVLPDTTSEPQRVPSPAELDVGSGGGRVSLSKVDDDVPRAEERSAANAQKLQVEDVPAESLGEEEMRALLTEASLSSVPLSSSDQAISVGRQSKDDQEEDDDDFW